MSRLPLDLFIEVEAHDGIRYKWDANQPPGSRLRNFSFRTKIGEGFSDASGQLARRIDVDYLDLNLVQTVTVAGADGSVAYEGRLAAMPRELSDSHSIGVTLAGWMSHAKDRKFSEIYVDRSLSAWSGQSLARRAAALAGNQSPTDGQATSDPTDNEAGIANAFQGAWVSPYTPTSEAWYDAGPGVTIGKISYSWKKSATVVHTDPSWAWEVFVASDDKGTAFEGTGNLRAAGPSVLQTFTPSAQYQYALLKTAYIATPAGAQGAVYEIDWYKPAVYGSHELTLHTGQAGEPDGIYVSDILRDIADRWCPMLDTSGVEDFDYVVQHCEFKDRAYPYDAFLELNKYALQHLAVWENKRLVFRPYDYSDYDWEIRTDDPGTTFSPQGPSTDDLFNGIAVTYTDLLTRTKRVITPDDDPDLSDPSTTNPWNQASVAHWDELEISTPVMREDALQIGRAKLAQSNTPKTPGTLTVRGYIRDRDGNEQPVWKVRAGDTISVTNFNDIVRLIVETDYDDETKTVRLAIDRPFQLLDAYFDRLANAVTARGLS